ncbi:MAG: PKD domain-containing protein [Candidatus Thermoplasmatota archaeon]|nr:PKD domain-containing protein [Candidatus Thermoplasmatota archaeon]
MKHSNLLLITMMISSLLLIATNPVLAADETITDMIEDVSSVDFNQQTTVVTSHPDINVSNIDIVEATYSQIGTQATVTMQVRGVIENRGKIIDAYTDDTFAPLNFVEYDFSLSTTEQDYTISYANQSGQVSNGLDTTNLTSADFTVTGDTLSITFQLTGPDEVYDNMSVTSMFVKMNFTATGEDFTDFVYLSDIAPNPALEIMEAYGPSVGAVGETIQFNGSIIPLTGQPPYQYSWDFGDGSTTSTDVNPTHIYTKAGEYTYTFTVTDQADDSVSETGEITISAEGSSNGDSGISNMTLFLVILAIIIIIGVVVIIWIIRR